MNMKRTLLLVICGLAMLLAPVSARAQVRDDGAFFSAQTKSELSTRIDDLRSRTGKKVVIETYTAVPAELRSDVSASDFWDRWIKSRGKANGADVMVLITRDPGHLEVGSSEAMRTSGAFTAADHRAVSSAMASYFKSREFDSGILRAMSVIEAQLKSGTTAARNAGGGNSAPAPTSASPNAGRGTGGVYGSSTPQPRSTCGFGGFGSLICVGIAVVGIFLLMKGILGSRRQMQQPPFGGQYGQQSPPPPGGYPYGGGGGGGGGFGRGVAGGVLGGLLGGWLGNRVFGQGQHGSSSVSPPPADNNFTPADPGPASSGFDFDSGGGGGGADFGGGGGADFGGGGGGGDSGGGGDASSGSDF